MRTKYKPWAVPYLLEHKEIAFTSFDKNNRFYNKTLCIEIGGGKGDFIIGLAKKHPKIHYLMVERVISVAAPAVKKIVDEKIKNVRVIYDNFINITHAIKKDSINKIYLNFSDPWPKKKHAKRRLTSESFLLDYYRILKKNGLIIFKSDQKGLYEYTKSMIDKKKFIILEDNSNYKKLDKDDVLTEYERKFREKGNIIYRLVIKKI